MSFYLNKMTNITVFKRPDVQEIKSNKTERDIMYDRFNKTAHIPTHHFNSFMEMEELYESNILINSDIPSILIKHSLKYCTPIIKNIDVYINALNHLKNTKTKPEIYKTPIFTVSTQLSHAIGCIIKSDEPPIYKRGSKNKSNDFYKNSQNSIIVPKNTAINIIGIYMPKIPILKIDHSFLNNMLEMEYNDIIKSGSFGLIEFQSNIYTHSKMPDIIPYTNETYIYFKSNEDALHKIKLVNIYIKYINDFYQNNMEIMIKHVYNSCYTHLKEHSKFINKTFNFVNNTGDVKQFIDKQSNVKQFIVKQSIVKPSTKLNQNNISEYIATNLHIKLYSSKFANDFMFDTNKVLDQFNQIKLMGVDHESSKKKINKMLIDQTNQSKSITFNKRKFEKHLEDTLKKNIAHNKFKMENLTDLSSNQLNIINLEYDKSYKLYNSIRQNSTDFSIVNALVYAIRQNDINLIKKKLIELEKIIKIPKDLEDIKLKMLQNSKNVKLICPHVISQAQYMVSNPNNLNVSGLIRDNLIKKFALLNTDNGFFCRICGELLALIDDDDILKYITGKRSSTLDDTDRLKHTIWTEVAHIIQTHVTFKYALNIKKIITSVTNNIRSEIGVIEINMRNIKSNSQDTIKDILRIYIVVYTFAVLVHMIYTNYGNITFKYRSLALNKNPKEQTYNKPEKSLDKPEKSLDKSIGVGGDVSKKTSSKKTSSKKPSSKKPSSKKTSSYIEYDKTKDTSKDTSKDTNQYQTTQKPNQMALQNIINTALVLILHDVNININKVKNMSTDSVKSILIKAYKWASSLESEKDVLINNKLDDNLLFSNDSIYNYVFYISNLLKIPNINVKTLMGRTIEQIKSDAKNNISIYSTIVIPKRNDNISQYKYDNFLYIMEYIKNKLYNSDASPYSDSLTEYDNKYKYIYKIANTLYLESKINELRPYTMIKLQNDYITKVHEFKSELIKIERYYDNEGNRHKFNIFVYQAVTKNGLITGPTYEYTKSDIENWLYTKNTKNIDKFKNLYIVDERCSVCKILLSKTKNNNIETAIINKDQIDMFYKYFYIRCPTGDLHNIELHDKLNICSKCGITDNIVKISDVKYYKKYVTTYDKILASNILIDKNKLLSIKKPTIIKQKYPAWKLNNAVILEFSRTFKVKYNVWNNLGLTIDRNYVLIESDKLNPANIITTNEIGLRNTQLHQYFLQIVTIFYTIKNYSMNMHLSYNIKKLMEKNTVTDIDKKLMDIDPNILNQYEYYKNNTLPGLLSNYLLYSISNTLIQIHKSINKAGMTNADAIIKYIIEYITNNEKIMSKPMNIKYVYVKNEKDSTLNVNTDDSDSDIDNGTDNGTGTDNDTDIDEEPDDLFSLDAVDLDDGGADDNL